jgi:hypothetical protein
MWRAVFGTFIYSGHEYQGGKTRMLVGAIWNATVWRRYHFEQIDRLSRIHYRRALVKQLGGRQFTLDGKPVDMANFIESNELTETELDDIAVMNIKEEKPVRNGSRNQSVLKRII